MSSGQASRGAAVAEKIKVVLEKARPLFDVACDVYNKAEPFAEKALDAGQELWEKLQPYHPEEILPALVGMGLIFFGGTFMTLIACLEAYRIAGWKETAESLKVLWDNYLKAKDAHEKDNKVDANKDGVADVNQIEATELATRKLRLMMKATDPNQIDRAITSIVSGFLAVVAALKIKFAKAITLGISIADVIEKNLETFVAPVTEKVVPEEYHKWLPLARKYAARTVGVTIAWWLARLMSAIHSAVRGAQLMISGLLQYTIRHKYISKEALEYSHVFEWGGWLIALFGLWMQLKGGFSLWFPFNILLFPLSMAETFLQYFVGFD